MTMPHRAYLMRSALTSPNPHSHTVPPPPAFDRKCVAKRFGSNDVCRRKEDGEHRDELGEVGGRESTYPDR